MKKLLIIFLLALLLLSCLGCGSDAPPPVEPTPGEISPEPEEEAPPLPDLAELPLLPELIPAEERLPGDWYAEIQGLLLQLRLSSDGSYTLLIPGSAQPERQGTWTLKDSSLFLDGEEELDVLADSLYWSASQIMLTREAPRTYTPAQPMADVLPLYYEGYWTCFCLGTEGAFVPADALGDSTALYIQGENVALCGSFFGNVPLAFAFEDGAMTAALGEGDGALHLRLRILDDGVLHLQVSGGKEQDFFLLRAVPPSEIDPEESPAP